MYTYDLVLLWPYLLISKSGVCCKRGNAISLVAQSWLVAVSTSTTKNRYITHNYTTKGDSFYQFRCDFRVEIPNNTTIKVKFAGNYTTNIVKILLIIAKFYIITLITTIKRVIGGDYTTIKQINTLEL